MTILSSAIAQSKFPALLKRVAAGEKIGIRYGKKVLKLEVVTKEPDDYAWTEYGLTRKEMKVIAKKLHAQTKKDLKSGNFREYHGDIEAMLKP